MRHADRFGNALRSRTVAAFALCSQDGIQTFESQLSMSARHPESAWLIASRKEKALKRFPFQRLSVLREIQPSGRRLCLFCAVLLQESIDPLRGDQKIVEGDVVI